jgi:anti-sigma28 factor (negative regulator of flagellin synthesis)
MLKRTGVTRPRPPGTTSATVGSASSAQNTPRTGTALGNIADYSNSNIDGASQLQQQIQQQQQQDPKQVLAANKARVAELRELIQQLEVSTNTCAMFL